MIASHSILKIRTFLTFLEIGNKLWSLIEGDDGAETFSREGIFGIDFLISYKNNFHINFFSINFFSPIKWHDTKFEEDWSAMLFNPERECRRLSTPGVYRARRPSRINSIKCQKCIRASQNVPTATNLSLRVGCLCFASSFVTLIMNYKHISLWKWL